MSVAFWSIELKSSKPAEVQPPEGYVLNVSQCALVPNSAKGPVSLKVLFHIYFVCLRCLFFMIYRLILRQLMEILFLLLLVLYDQIQLSNSH